MQDSAPTNDAVKTAQKAFFHAIRAIIRFEETAAGCRLNATRRQLLGSRHFTEAKDADFEKLAPDLNQRFFEAMYGDYKSTAQNYPWIRDPAVIAIIDQQVQQHGNADDHQAFENFKRQTAATFGGKSVIALAA